jgi:hypothetical protein
MRRAAIYTFIETAKLTRSETLPLKLVDQAALVRIDLPGEFHRAGTFLQYGRPPLGGTATAASSEPGQIRDVYSPAFLQGG